MVRLIVLYVSISILLVLTIGSHGEDVKLVSYYATPSMPYREGDDPNSNYEGCSLVDLSGNMLKCRPPGVLFDGKVDGSLNISNQINRYKYHTWNTSSVTLIFELDRPVVFQSVRLQYLSNNNVKDIGNAPVGKPLVYTTNSSTTTEPGMPNRARHISSGTQQSNKIYSAEYSGFDDEYGSVLHLTFDFGSTKWFFLTAAEIRVNDAGREYKVTSFVQPVEESSPIPSSTMSPTSAATSSDTPLSSTPPTSTSPSPTSTPSGATTVAVKSEIYIIIVLVVVIAALILVVGSVIVCLLCKTKRVALFSFKSGRNIDEEQYAELAKPPVPYYPPNGFKKSTITGSRENHSYDEPQVGIQPGYANVSEPKLNQEDLEHLDRLRGMSPVYAEPEAVSQHSFSQTKASTLERLRERRTHSRTLSPYLSDPELIISPKSLSVPLNEEFGTASPSTGQENVYRTLDPDEGGSSDSETEEEPLSSNGPTPEVPPFSEDNYATLEEGTSSEEDSSEEEDLNNRSKGLSAGDSDVPVIDSPTGISNKDAFGYSKPNKLKTKSLSNSETVSIESLHTAPPQTNLVADQD